MLTELEYKATLRQQQLEQELKYVETVVNIEIDTSRRKLNVEASAERIKTNAEHMMCEAHQEIKDLG